MKKKRDAFIASLDKNLTAKQREDMVRDFDNRMANLANMLQKEMLD